MATISNTKQAFTATPDKKIADGVWRRGVELA